MSTKLIPCPACRKQISPFHAGLVTILERDEVPEWWYFCDRACRDRAFASLKILDRAAAASDLAEPRTSGATQTPLPAASTSGLVSGEVGFSILDDQNDSYGETEGVEQRTPSPAHDATLTANSPQQGLGQTSRSNDVASDAYAEDPPDLDSLLLAIAAGSGLLGIGLSLIGSSPTVVSARVVVVAVGVLALGSRVMASGKDPSDAHPFALLLAPLVAAGVAVAARWTGDKRAGEAVSVAGMIVLVAAVLMSLRRRASQDLDAERKWLADALSLPARRVGGIDARLVAAHELRSGEEIEVNAGEIVPADMVVLKGRALVLPWLGQTATASRTEGDLVVAGARVLEGKLLGLTTWTGHERAWARLVLDPYRRVDVHSVMCRMARSTAEIGSIGAALLAGLAAFANNAPMLEVALSAAAAHAALASTAVTAAAALHSLRGVLLAARRGIAFRDHHAWDAASRVTVTVFGGRGTLLLGEPEVVEVEPTGRASADQVLAWVAGVAIGQNHPFSQAPARAARRRGVTPDAVRSSHHLQGIGITAVTSSGESLLVGSRALMLQERVSVALSEPRVAELESLGRNVLLVAVSGKLVGLVALQDGLRPGARPAVQHLLDAEIEPVLLSGDARETCEAIARALDIDHIRPEIMPNDRAAEIRRLSEGGARVATIGRPDLDGPMLGAAEVSVALSAAGTSPGDWSVTLASDDVRDAALSLAIAHRARVDTRTAFLLAVAPGVLAALAVAFRFLPPLFAPVAALLGGAITILHVRSSSPARRDRGSAWDLPATTR